MVFLCLNCGRLNTADSLASPCVECGEPLQKDNYTPVLGYAKQAVRYGYDYRLTYEEQVQRSDRVNGKYSLTQPSSLWELLAATILTNVAYDALKYITKQVIAYISQSPAGTNSDYDRLLSVITDSNKLKQFIIYIQEYHSQTMNTPPPVIEAIDEEKWSDLLGEKANAMIAQAVARGNELTPQELGAISAQAAREVLRDGVESYYASPSQQQLESVLQSLKRRTGQLTQESKGDTD